MHPVLLELGSFTVYSYGFLMAVGFLLAYYVTVGLARQLGLNVEQFKNLYLFTSIVGYCGTRVLYVVVKSHEAGFDPVKLLQLWTQGLVWYGGPLFAVPFLIWYTRRIRMPILTALDIAMVGVTLGHMIGRFGCFLAGCCHGKPTDSSLGIRFFSPLVPSHLQGVSLHPTQLYEALGLFVLFVLFRYRVTRRSFEGEVFFLYLLLYPILRSVVEVFRGDQERGFVIPEILSTSQFISIFVFLAALIGLLCMRKRASRLQSSAHP